MIGFQTDDVSFWVLMWTVGEYIVGNDTAASARCWLFLLQPETTDSLYTFLWRKSGMLRFEAWIVVQKSIRLHHSVTTD